MMASFSFVVFALSLATAVHGEATCYDHQTKDYNTQFNPAECNAACTVTPFFSPDHSLDTYLDLIQSATETIDIYTPGEFVCVHPIPKTGSGELYTS
jgi:hypothetical protein